MTLQEQREYLGFAVELEAHIYQLTALLKNLERKTRSLGVPKQYSPPSRPPSPTDWDRYMLLAFLCIALPLIAFYVSLNFDTPVAQALAALVRFFPYPLLSLVGIFWVWSIVRRMDREQKRQEKWQEIYRQRVSSYHRRQEADQKRVAREQKQLSALKGEMALLQAQRDRFAQLLSDLYDRELLFPKYRTLPLAATLYEYLCSGRCDRLEGTAGAYGLLEAEIRQELVIPTLDRAAANLDKLQQDQFVLRDIILDCRRRTDQLMDALGQFTGDGPIPDLLLDYKAGLHQKEQLFAQQLSAPN